MIRTVIILFIVFSSTSALAQVKKKKGHELELNVGYSFYNPTYIIGSTVDWGQIELNKHIARYGFAYTFTTKRTRSQINLGSYKVDYTFERSAGDGFGWQEYGGAVSQQWFEMGFLEGFMVVDSLNLYPVVGLSYGFPVKGSSEGFKQTGSSSNIDQDITYNFDEAAGKRLDLRLGFIYQFKFDGNIGVNTYLLYSKSLLKHEIPGSSDIVGQYKVNQFMFNLGITYTFSCK